jgi:uncharacterized protein with PQ loop repeat
MNIGLVLALALNEDTIMSVVSLVFIFGMVVQIKKILASKDTSAFSHTLIWGNSLALIVIFSCMFSLGLIFSGSILILQALAWAIIGFLKIRYEKE